MLKELKKKNNNRLIEKRPLYTKLYQQNAAILLKVQQFCSKISLNPLTMVHWIKPTQTEYFWFGNLRIFLDTQKMLENKWCQREECLIAAVNWYLAVFPLTADQSRSVTW